MARAKTANDLASIFSPPAPLPAGGAEPTAAAGQSRVRTASREGKRGKLVYLTEAAEKQLSYMGLEQDKTQQALMIEAVNLLFAHYGRDQIA
ncbi:MAG: hypothetical protein KDI64_00650 [Candidatus Accumulibacter sp.]|nr:hypothetical protein [Accumulibacter sp.]